MKKNRRPYDELDITPERGLKSVQTAGNHKKPRSERKNSDLTAANGPIPDLIITKMQP